MGRPKGAKDRKPRKRRGPLSAEHRRKMSESHRGHPTSTERRENISKALRGRLGDTLMSHGYTLVKKDDRGPRRWQRRARVAMEQKLRRPLGSQEVVHHVNFDRADDHPDNLYLFGSNSAHRRFHMLIQRLGIVENFKTAFSKAAREAAA